MRDRGLLDAVADAADRRSVRLSLLADGQTVQTVQSTLQQQARRLRARGVAGLTTDQRRELLALLRRVGANLVEVA